jgi:hypothetical protein
LSLRQGSMFVTEYLDKFTSSVSICTGWGEH